MFGQGKLGLRAASLAAILALAGTSRADGASASNAYVTVTAEDAVMVIAVAESESPDFEVVVTDNADVDVMVEANDPYTLAEPMGGEATLSESNPEVRYRIEGDNPEDPPVEGWIRRVVLNVDLDDSDLWFFRNEDYELPLTITPSSVSDLVNVSVSGFDDIHWTAAYNAPFMKVDFSNLILESELVGWLDERELSISAGVGSAADIWSWTKKLKLKKRLDGLWDDVKQDAIGEVNDLVSPADEIKTLVQDNLTDVSAIDSEGLLHTIPLGAINSAANFAYASISTWWADFVGSYIWSDVPVSELHEKVTRESWTWDWNVDAEIDFSGGSISLEPGFSDAAQWIKSISNTGFSSDTFVFQNAMIRTSVTADGETANADVEAIMNAFLRYSNETVIDIETGETAEGRIEYGIGIPLHIWF